MKTPPHPLPEPARRRTLTLLGITGGIFLAAAIVPPHTAEATQASTDAANYVAGHALTSNTDRSIASPAHIKV